MLTCCVIITVIIVTLCCLVAPNITLGDGQLARQMIAAESVLNLAVSIARFNLRLTNITWTHNGSILMNQTDRVTIANPDLSDLAPVMSSLQRSSLIPSDAGDYTVTATNLVNSDNLTFSIIVIGKYGLLLFMHQYDYISFFPSCIQYNRP